MKYIYSLLFLSMFLQNTNAQVIGDALRYAYTEPTGTARTLGLGGAISAIGSDFSTLSKNPAGLAWYRRSELVLTPSLTLTNVTSELVGGEMRDRDRPNVNFNNFGFVIKGRDRKSTDLKFLNFAMGYNRIADFHQDSNFAGTTPGSITDRFLELTSDGNPNTPNLTPDELDDFEAGLAYEAGALYEVGGSGQGNFYGTDFVPGELSEKSQIIQSTGGINEFTFSMGANYNEKLMVGATVGVPVVSFSESKTYRQTDEDSSTEFFDELEYKESLIQTGTGINLKIGAIFRATQAIRLGAAIHTPTSFKLEDNFSSSLQYAYTDGSGLQDFTAESPDGTFNYKVKTPMSVIGSGAFIIGKMGLISAEVEWQDYTKTEFNFNKTTEEADLAYEAELNAQIKENFKSAVKIRLGGEFAYEKLRLRAGYGLIGSPYAEGDSFYNSFSAGIGLRQRSFYMDLGYRHTVFGETYVPYVTFDKEVNPEQEVLNSTNKDTFLLTFGFRF
ncbi:MAG: hypothetical protein ACI85O_003762 [Saprospiraceae bacterium]|jgi:hypothetical protein